MNSSSSSSWGYHLMLDCKSCDKSKIASEDTIRDFIKDLLLTTDMKAWGEPIIANLQDCEDHIKGFSAVQLIHTSSITCHFSDQTGDSYIDVFSCKEFDIEKVKDCVSRYFSPQHMKSTFLLRDASTRQLK